jgi:hypothetical protein
MAAGWGDGARAADLRPANQLHRLRERYEKRSDIYEAFLPRVLFDLLAPPCRPIAGWVENPSFTASH